MLGLGDDRQKTTDEWKQMADVKKRTTDDRRRATDDRKHMADNRLPTKAKDTDFYLLFLSPRGTRRIEKCFQHNRKKKSLGA